MNALLFEQIFDPLEVNFYVEVDGDECESVNLGDTDASIPMMD